MIEAEIVRAWVATSRVPGAIAIVEVVGDVHVLGAGAAWLRRVAPGGHRLVDVPDVDECVVCRPRRDLALVMPHGGLRIVQRLLEHLATAGARIVDSPGVEPSRRYAEAADAVEALMLHALSGAASPLAIDLLLDQPRRWRSHPTMDDADHARSKRLNRLLTPPVVVLAGGANVGKSTLSNRLLGRTMSIEADVPGTTRDYTSALIDLQGLVVAWHDTPGFRDTDDPIEREAMGRARRIFEEADLVIAMTDDVDVWPRLPREPDLRVVNKVDRMDTPVAAPMLGISAKTGAGLEQLVRTVRDMLIPETDLSHPGGWIFDERLLTS
jgi:tRNA modification GTPase